MKSNKFYTWSLGKLKQNKQFQKEIADATRSIGMDSSQTESYLIWGTFYFVEVNFKKALKI